MTEHLPLSVGQQAMWFLHRLKPDSAAYNVTLGVRVAAGPGLERLDPEGLGRAVGMVEERQSVLRTTFVERDGEPWRVIWPAGHGGPSPRFEVREVPGTSDDRLLELARLASTAPFALAAGERPVRVVLLRRTPDDALLVITAHHIAADAPSLFLLLRDLLDAYEALGAGRAPAWRRLSHSYDDYIERERLLLASPRAERMARYWASSCAGSVAAQLPTDRGGPARPGPAGATRPLPAMPGLAGTLRAASQSTGVTPFAYLLGAFQAMLHRYTGLDDFMIGTAVALRVHPGLRDVAGYMVNVLPLRARFTARTTLADAVASASDQIRGGMAHMTYPGLLTDAGQTPLFRVTCTMLAVDQLAVSLPADRFGLQLSYVDIAQQEGQFDLSVELRQQADAVTGVLRYDANLFDRATVDGFAERFARFAEHAVSYPHTRVADLALVDDAELGRVLAFGGIN